MVTSCTAAPDIEILTSNFPIPGYGVVPINAFVIKGPSPSWSKPARRSRAPTSCRRCDRSSIQPISDGSG